MANLPEIPSPCVGVCKMDRARKYCEGCLRTIEEIRVWSRADNETRYAIVQDLKQRRIAAGRVSKSDLKPRRRRRGQ